MGTEEPVASSEAEIAPTDLEKKIIRQVEYYFGNYNLSRDRFLREQIKLDDGWVPMETLLKFKRLKEMSDDSKVITEALKKSPAQLLEVSEDGDKIRRTLKAPLPENSEQRRDEIDSRSLYVKGFKSETTLDELLDFFKPHKVENITMRRRQNKVFKGSVYITFETLEDADTFFKDKDLKFGSTDLLKEFKKDYCARKEIFHEQIKLEREKKRQQKKLEPKIEEPEPKAPTDFPKGCLLKITELNPKLSREDLKTAFKDQGNLKYVDFNRGDTEAVMRFAEATPAKIFEEAETEDDVKKFEIGSEKCPISLVEGDDEVNYWKTIVSMRSQHKYSKPGNRNNRYQPHGRGRFNKKNRGKRQKHEDDDNDDDESEEPVKKKAKADSDNDDANGHTEVADCSEPAKMAVE